MMQFGKLLGAAALTMGVAACASTPPPAPQPAPPPPPVAAPAPPAAPSVADLVGARATAGQRQLAARGYRMARARGLTRYYAHAPSQSCIRVQIANGRYRAIESEPVTSCVRSSPPTRS
jgi:hypothetical protein